MTAFQTLADRWISLKARLTPWLPYYQELGDVLLPNRADFIRQRTRGHSRETAIYDGTPRMALRDLASTLDGLMKPKGSNWFEPTVNDKRVADLDESKLWFDIVRDIMWRGIYSRKARFIQRSGEVDTGLAAFGWGTLWMQENRDRTGLLFRSFHNSKVAYDENEDGIIDTIGIEEPMTARQAEMLYKRAGKDIPQKLKETLADEISKTTERFRIVQIVMPRDDRDATAIGSINMPFLSAVIDITSEVVIVETGFEEFPAAIPRWETSPGEIYPRSPGMMALPDSKTLQAMGKTLLVGGQRAVDPPFWVQNDSVLSPLRTFPGGVTVLDISDGGTPMGAFPVSTNIPLGKEMQDDYRKQVEAAFFKNVFNLPIAGRAMTATEILERKEEFIRAIGPVFGRLESDYIGHIAERSFGIMERAGAFPKRPDVLVGHEIVFLFQSPIQQARRQIEIAGLSRSIEVLEPLVAMQPEIMDNFDGDEIARDAPEWSGMPQRWLRPLEARDQIRQSRAQQQQEALAAEQLEPTSKAIKNVATAEGALAEQGPPA